MSGIFVRVYNDQPAFPLGDPAAFCKGLVSYIHAKTRQDASAPGNSQLIACLIVSLTRVQTKIEVCMIGLYQDDDCKVLVCI